MQPHRNLRYKTAPYTGELLIVPMAAFHTSTINKQLLLKKIASLDVTLSHPVVLCRTCFFCSDPSEGMVGIHGCILRFS